MKGNNTLQLNEATMIEAVQYWLNGQFVIGRAPKVTGVTCKDSYSSEFEIEVSASEPKA